ncbi:25887_t:CDS:2 [Gigaspora margarita]|uniref:25887_t:CDS:1 n=1 Tax=Gigaspora margarita TaxID=4874 RepID=A0ABN7VGV2_GIGMA|nr:25887_t:CDS:2 [Gigaspora margarita]
MVTLAKYTPLDQLTQISILEFSDDRQNQPIKLDHMLNGLSSNQSTYDVEQLKIFLDIDPQAEFSAVASGSRVSAAYVEFLAFVTISLHDNKICDADQSELKEKHALLAPKEEADRLEIIICTYEQQEYA